MTKRHADFIAQYNEIQLLQSCTISFRTVRLGFQGFWLDWILVPVVGLVIAYGIAIPNILSHALRQYSEQTGAAGALFGLVYYLLLALMLGLAGVVQQLGLVLTACAMIAWLCRPSSISH
ncbi:MAG: hypothetical protein HamCj_14890 [Candidatus Hamiltonella defensa (Ceratovacuna japonica)]